MNIHKYTDNTYVRSFTVGSSYIPESMKELRGIGEHPSENLLNSLGWYLVEDRPEAPGENYTWNGSDPAFILVDGKSVPQGEWTENLTEAELLQADPDKWPALINFITYLSEIAVTYDLTFQDYSFQEIMSVIEASAMEDVVKVTVGQKLRTLWDVVVFEYDSMQQAYSGLFIALSALG